MYTGRLAVAVLLALGVSSGCGAHDTSTSESESEINATLNPGNPLAIDGNGNLYITNIGPTGSGYSEIRKIGAGAAQCNVSTIKNGSQTYFAGANFAGVAVDPAGTLYAADNTTCNILKIPAGASSATTYVTLSDCNGTHGAHGTINDIAIDADGNIDLLITSGTTSVVEQVQPTSPLPTVARLYTGTTTYNHLAVSPSGSALYLARINAVYQVDLNNSSNSGWVVQSSPFPSSFDFSSYYAAYSVYPNYPSSIQYPAFDTSCPGFFCGYDYHSIPGYTWGEFGTALQNISGLTTDADGNIYVTNRRSSGTVTDLYNSNVQIPVYYPAAVYKFAPGLGQTHSDDNVAHGHSVLLASDHNPGVGDGVLGAVFTDGPTAVAFSAAGVLDAGTLYVLDGGRVRKIDAWYYSLSTVAGSATKGLVDGLCGEQCGTQACGANAFCGSDDSGAPSCLCNDGFLGDGTTCHRPCGISNGGCSADATCDDYAANHCTCNSGFIGDGVSCEPTASDGSITMSHGTAVVTFEGAPGVTYQVQASSDLKNWSTIGSATADASGSIVYDDSANVSIRYYRLHLTTAACAVGQMQVGQSCATIKSVSSSHAGTCAVTSAGTVRCWGTGFFANGQSISDFPADVPGLSNITQVVSGSNHSCALDTAGNVSCWGANDSGQLGNGTNDDHGLPTPVSLPNPAVTLAAGGNSTCAILNDGTAMCWGEDDQDQLGDWGNTNSSVPVNVQGVTQAQAISVSVTNGCVLQAGGLVWCWGGNTSSQLGASPAGPDPTTICGGLGNSTLPCWNQWINNHSTFVWQGLTSGVKSIAVGENIICAIKTDNQVYCSGANTNGQLGNGTTTDSARLVSPTNLGAVTSLTVGDAHMCAIASGVVKCWGRNAEGELGIGGRATQIVPAAATGLGSGIATVHAGSRNSCAITTAGSLECWGKNDSGQIGDGTVVDRLTATAVSSRGDE